MCPGVRQAGPKAEPGAGAAQPRRLKPRQSSPGVSVGPSIDEHVVQLSGFKAKLFNQLARRSALAEAASELPAGTRDVTEGELLEWARQRYNL